MSGYPMGLSIGPDLMHAPASFFEELKANGIEYAEVSMCGENHTTADSEELAAILNGHGMKLWSIHVPFGRSYDISSPDEAVRTLALENIIPYMALAARLGIGRVVVHPSTEPIDDADRPAHKDAFRKSLPVLCDAAEAAGVTLCIENLPRTCLLNTSAESMELISADPRARMVLDTNHMLQEQAHDFAKVVAPLVRTLHISDYDMTNEKHWLPGEGIADFPAMFAALRAAGYDGVYMMELGKHKDGRDFTAREAADALKAVL